MIYREFGHIHRGKGGDSDIRSMVGGSWFDEPLERVSKEHKREREKVRQEGSPDG